MGVQARSHPARSRSVSDGQTARLELPPDAPGVEVEHGALAEAQRVPHRERSDRPAQEPREHDAPVPGTQVVELHAGGVVHPVQVPGDLLEEDLHRGDRDDTERSGEPLRERRDELAGVGLRDGLGCS